MIQLMILLAVVSTSHYVSSTWGAWLVRLMTAVRMSGSCFMLALLPEVQPPAQHLGRLACKLLSMPLNRTQVEQFTRCMFEAAEHQVSGLSVWT